MGQVNTTLDDVISDDQELTDDEKKIISEQDDLFRQFHTTPSAKNYWAIRQNDKIYRKSLGSKIYRMFVLGMKTHESVGNTLTKEEKIEYNIETEKLLNFSNILTAFDMDILWTLYYATGDRKFPDRIKIVINDRSQDLIIQGAAQWSYYSHVNQNLL